MKQNTSKHILILTHPLSLREKLNVIEKILTDKMTTVKFRKYKTYRTGCNFHLKYSHIIYSDFIIYNFSFSLGNDLKKY